MKIYTKKGDSGETSLLGGKKVSKADKRLNAYGTIDELNSFLGLLRTKLQSETDKKFVFEVQQSLFVVGAVLAMPTEEQNKFAEFDASLIEKLEQKMDCIENELPPLKNFVVYGDNEISAICHICRSIARRAEREIVLLHQSDPVEQNIIKYINRLSDWLFVLARKLS